MSINTNHIEFRQLRYFVAVAEELHFSKAAQKLHISQPPLSQQIMALEAHIGTPLFIRTKRCVQLTDAGRVLLSSAKRILMDVAETGRRIQDASTGEIGELRIGVNYSSPLNPVFSRIIRSYKSAYPKIKISLIENSSPKQEISLHENLIDVCFIWPLKKNTDKEISFIPVAKDPLRIVVPRMHKLARQKSLKLDDILSETIFLTPRQTRTALYEHLQSLYIKKHLEPFIQTDIAQLPIILSMVAAHLGVGILPHWLDMLQKDDVVFRPIVGIPQQDTVFPLSIAYRSKDNSQTVKNFLKIVEK